MVMNLQAQNGTTGSEEGVAVIKGHIKNNVDDFWEFAQNKYIGFTSTSIPIDKNGNFNKAIKVEGDVQDVAVLFHTTDFVPLFIQKNDTIEITWDENNFEKTFAVKNSRIERDHVLQTSLSTYKLYKKNYFALQDSLHKLTSADSKFSMINNCYNEEIEALLAGGVYEGTAKVATDIYFRYALLLFNSGLLPAYELYIKQPTTNSSLVPMLSAEKYYKTESENAFRMSEAYRNFLFDYVRFYRPLDRWEVSGSVAESNNKVVPFAPSWDDYYAGLKSFRIYELRDWFITKSIISDFAHYSFEDATAVYKDFMTKVKTPYFADTLKIFYANMQRLKPGSPAPAFTLKDENGKPVSLSDFRGKVVFIDFWGIHCGPCLYEIKNNFPALKEKYKNVIFLNICVDADEKEWKENLVKLNLQGVNLITEGWRIKNPVCITYGVNGIPHYYLIDKGGKIADNNAPRPSEGERLHAALDKLLSK